MAALGITILKNNVPWGPFTRAQIEDGLARRDFTVHYLAHAPGLKEWLPLGEVLDYVDRNEGSRTPSLPPVPAPRELPPVPSVTPVPETVEPAVIKPEPAPSIPAPVASRPPILPASPPPPPPVIEKREIKPEPQVLPKPAAQLTPAPLILRGLAFLIDSAILFMPIVILFALGALAIEISAAWRHIPHEAKVEDWEQLEQSTKRLFWLVLIGFGWLYLAGLECSPSQASVGKRWMGLKVTDAHGERLSFLHASARYAAKYLSALPCFLGFALALFSSRGLALHDRLTDTRVVSK